MWLAILSLPRRARQTKHLPLERTIDQDDQDDLSAERQALTDAKSAFVESAATEVVNAGRLLFKYGEPNDPALQRRYRLYKRLEAALAMPAGSKRLEALYKAYRDLRAN
jgi:hypothetical protein